MLKHFFFSILVTLLTLACNSPESGDPIHIVVPDQYLGVFKIEVDMEAERLERKDDHYKATIPQSGVLRVRDTDPFKRFHETKVTFEGGGRVPSGTMTQNGDQIAYYYLWSDTRGSIWFIIGNRDDYERAQKAHELRVGEDFVVQ